MKLFFITFLIGVSSIYAQQIDYNTKKGFIANGYDVVSYFDGNPLKGDKQFITIYKGVKYTFFNEKNLAVFKTNPSKYSPQYGGYCAYAIGVNGKKVGINPETYQILDNKLYLFYNAWGTNTLELWKKDVKGLQNKADRNWESIKLKN